MITQERYKERIEEMADLKDKLERDIDRLNKIVSILGSSLSIPYDKDLDLSTTEMQEEFDKLEDSLEAVMLIS